MTKPSELQVIENVSTLVQQYQPFRRRAKTDADVYSLRRLPQLSPGLAREDAIYLLSADVMHEAKLLSAFWLAMSSEYGVTPTQREPGGTVKPEHQRKADALESAYALTRYNLDPNLVLRWSNVWRMLVQPATCTRLEMHGIDSPNPGDRFPWCAYEVELDGCGWQERNSIPTIFAQDYKQLVYDVVREYSNRRGTESQGSYFDWKDGKWDKKTLTDDWSPTLPPVSRRGDSSTMPEVHMYFLDDGDWMTIVGLDEPPRKIAGFTLGKQGGKILWQERNPFGRVSAFIASGEETPLREPTEHRRPFLEPLITVTQQINVTMSTIATAARNKASTRNYVNPSPEQVAKMVGPDGKWNPPPPVSWANLKAGDMPVIIGDIGEVPSTVDPSLIDQLKILLAQRDRYIISSFTSLLQPDVVDKATASGWLGAFDAGTQQLSKPVGQLDIMDRQITEAIEHSVKFTADNYGKKYAQFDMIGGGQGLRTSKGDVSRGTRATLDADIIDFPHTITVRTESRTVAQQQQRYALALGMFAPKPDGSPGIGLDEELMDAIGENDPTGRSAKLAKQGMWLQVDPTLPAQAGLATAQLRIEADYGLRPPLLAMSAMGGAGAPPEPGAVPQGPQRMAAPTTEVVSGSTAAPGM